CLRARSGRTTSSCWPSQRSKSAVAPRMSMERICSDAGVLGLRCALEAALIDGEARSKFRHLRAHALLDARVTQVRKHIRDPSADGLHFWLAHSACRHRWAAQADAGSLHRWEGVQRNGVHVDGVVDAGWLLFE